MKCKKEALSENPKPLINLSFLNPFSQKRFCRILSRIHPGFYPSVTRTFSPTHKGSEKHKFNYTHVIKSLNGNIR